MSAAVLREAAALMRSRAEGATPGPWFAETRMVIATPTDAKYIADCFDEPGVADDDAMHIASWHPAVALAVAGWLDVFADYDETGENAANETAAALAVAHAYLGTEATA